MENVELVSVTPDLAREWLVSNTHNRSLRQRVVMAYAADMAEGNWQWNGDSVKFAGDGTLLDGQHRLAAIAEADVTVQVLVVRGLPNRAQETVDGGNKRSFSDVLHLRGEVNTHTLAAVTRRVTAWETGARRTGTKIKYAPTNAQLLQTLEKYPDLRSIALTAHTASQRCDIPASIIGLCWWLFDQLSSEDTEFFFGRLADGQGLHKGDPVYELRRTTETSRAIRGQRSETFLTAIVIKAWNAYRDGAQVGLLIYRPGGSRPERFPEPH